jgi:hypothetical protein
MANFMEKWGTTPGLLKQFGSSLGGGLSNFGNKVKTGIQNSQNRYNNLSDSQKAFANSLLDKGIKQLQPNNQYDFNPSMIDYSQYMGGLSPETQRYLYGGM